MTVVNTGDRPFTCPHESCGKTFMHQNSMKIHMMSHSGHRPHACKVCGKGESIIDDDEIPPRQTYTTLSSLHDYAHAKDSQHDTYGRTTVRLQILRQKVYSANSSAASHQIAHSQRVDAIHFGIRCPYFCQQQSVALERLVAEWSSKETAAPIAIVRARSQYSLR